MLILKSVNDLERALKGIRKEHRKVGFVPTMGALHAGHMSLIERSKAENDVTVCSIFINPRQFNDPKDLEKYPRPIENDTIMLAEAGADILFFPGVEDIYPPDYQEPEVDLKGLDKVFEGALRPGHFKGVATVVKRLFDCVKPDKAYFGQKDFQQTLVIKELVSQCRLPVEIIVSGIVREANGLAMSSRNARLSANDRSKAGSVYLALIHLREFVKEMPLDKAIIRAKDELSGIPNLHVEYIEIVDPLTLQAVASLNNGHQAIALAAVNCSGVRLLDNLYL